MIEAEKANRDAKSLTPFSDCIRGDFHGLAVKIELSMNEEEAAWVTRLRACGVKAAHPDDGWVNREKNSVYFCYPQFNDNPVVGDLIALGWPQWSMKKPQHRLVRVTEIFQNLVGKNYGFEPFWPMKSDAIDSARLAKVQS